MLSIDFLHEVKKVKFKTKKNNLKVTSKNIFIKFGKILRGS